MFKSIWNKLTWKPKSRDDIHSYWENPDDGYNRPEEYLGEKQSQKMRSQFLGELLLKYVTPEARVLEIGCNVGRNLDHLFRLGFGDLSAIEINEEAIRMLREHFPEMAAKVSIHNSSVEEVVKGFADTEFDVVFTMAVLEHVHTESEWIFKEMARTAGQYLVTIEDENSTSPRHFPRNYRKIFECYDLEQVEEINCCMDKHGLSGDFFARVFAKRSVRP